MSPAEALYGLKQAPRAWYSRINTYLQDLSFEESEVDPNLYYLVDGEDRIILVLYLDDLFITGAKRLIGRCKVDLSTEFEMKDISMMHYFLGMKVWQKDGRVPCVPRPVTCDTPDLGVPEVPVPNALATCGTAPYTRSCCGSGASRSQSLNSTDF